MQLHHYVNDEARLKQLVSKCIVLSGIIAPVSLRSYEELKEKLERVLGTLGSTSTAESVAEDMEEVPWSNVNKTVAVNQ